MKLLSTSFKDSELLAGEFAFADIDPYAHVALSSNRNPHLAWSEVPAGTRSFALICHDPDVPSRPDDVNKEGREIPSSLPRVDFYHWLLLGIPAQHREITAGSHSRRVTARGKSGPAALGGLQHGINDYTGWFASDKTMEGNYYGYDGPCPPWNDSILHHYVFTLYALDVERVTVQSPMTGVNVTAALKGHILGKASIMGTYTLNPRLRLKQAA
jgi:Raf kinase inhibitor-like YbhB/YbcL family protein